MVPLAPGLAGVALADHTVLPISGVAVLPASGEPAWIQPLVRHFEQLFQCPHGGAPFLLLWWFRSSFTLRQYYHTITVVLGDL
jgi:hypothetical protein